MISVDIHTPEGRAAYEAFHDPEKLYKLWKEENNLGAARFLGDSYFFGDEKYGTFKDYKKAKEIYTEIGEDKGNIIYEEEEDPHTGIFTLSGSAEDIKKIMELINKLVARYGMGDNEFGLYVPMAALMKALVESINYDGNLLYMDQLNDTTLKITAELNKPEVLKYAFLKAFPDLSIEMEVETI